MLGFTRRELREWYDNMTRINSPTLDANFKSVHVNMMVKSRMDDAKRKMGDGWYFEGSNDMSIMEDVLRKVIK